MENERVIVISSTDDENYVSDIESVEQEYSSSSSELPEFSERVLDKPRKLNSFEEQDTSTVQNSLVKSSKTLQYFEDLELAFRLSLQHERNQRSHLDCVREFQCDFEMELKTQGDISHGNVLNPLDENGNTEKKKKDEKKKKEDSRGKLKDPEVVAKRVDDGQLLRHKSHKKKKHDHRRDSQDSQDSNKSSRHSSKHRDRSDGSHRNGSSRHHSSSTRHHSSSSHRKHHKSSSHHSSSHSSHQLLTPKTERTEHETDTTLTTTCDSAESGLSSPIIQSSRTVHASALSKQCSQQTDRDTVCPSENYSASSATASRVLLHQDVSSSSIATTVTQSSRESSPNHKSSSRASSVSRQSSAVHRQSSQQSASSSHHHRHSTSSHHHSSSSSRQHQPASQQSENDPSLSKLPHIDGRSPSLSTSAAKVEHRRRSSVSSEGSSHHHNHHTSSSHHHSTTSSHHHRHTTSGGSSRKRRHGSGDSSSASSRHRGEHGVSDAEGTEAKRLRKSEDPCSSDSCDKAGPVNRKRNSAVLAKSGVLEEAPARKVLKYSVPLLTRAMNNRLYEITHPEKARAKKPKVTVTKKWDNNIYDPEFSDSETDSIKESFGIKNSVVPLKKLSPRTLQKHNISVHSADEDDDDESDSDSLPELENASRSESGTGSGRHFMDFIAPDDPDSNSEDDDKSPSPPRRPSSPQSDHLATRTGDLSLFDDDDSAAEDEVEEEETERQPTRMDLQPCLCLPPIREEADQSESSESDDELPPPPLPRATINGMPVLSRRPRVSNHGPIMDASAFSSYGARKTQSPPKRESRRNETSGVTHRILNRTAHAQRDGLFCCVPLHPPITAPGDAEMTKTGDTVNQFTQGMENTVLACLDDNFLSNGVSLLDSMLSERKEPSVALQERLLEILMDSKDKKVSYMMFNQLMKLVKLHPPYKNLPFNFDTISQAVDDINLKIGIFQVHHGRALSAALALTYMVEALEAELLQRSLASAHQFRASVIYQWTGNYGSFYRIKQVVSWLCCAVHYGQYEELVEPFPRLAAAAILGNHGDEASSDSKATPADLPKVLPVLERLLDLALTVQMEPDATANRVADQLYTEYKNTSMLWQKHVLVSSLSSPLLRLKLCQRVLEHACCSAAANAGTYASLSAAFSLEDLIPAYFSASLPPATYISLPLTPSDVEGNSRDSADADVNPEGGGGGYSAESCEELIMLLWTVVSSYITAKRGKLFKALHFRALDKCDLHASPLRLEDQTMLRRMPEFVRALRDRLQAECLGPAAHFTGQTEIYFAKLEGLACLGD